MNEANLPFNHIYSTLYDTISKRYITLFAIIWEMFRNFFSDTKDNLD
jgi:hypothetical protein